MADHYSLSMIIAGWIFKFSHSFLSSLDDCVFFVFFPNLVVFTIPHLILKGAARVQGRQASLLWRFLFSIPANGETGLDGC